MNVFTRRPNLSGATQRAIKSSKVAQYQDYVEESDELGVEEDEFESEADDYDADQELQYQRAELDGRLKNTFESIFAKYERDFDGIGDEIDLRTGEVVVNNGHLLEMTNERDAGLLRRRRDLREVLEQEEDFSDVQSSLNEQEIQDSAEENKVRESEEEASLEVFGSDVEGGELAEEDEEGNVDEEAETATETSMDDDDLIFRGFAQANRFVRAPSARQVNSKQFALQSRSRALQDGLPPHNDILEQFGPELGAQIAGYIAQQEQATRERNIEPAWRAPALPSFPQARPSVPRFRSRAPTMIRAQSPEESASIWTAPGLRRPRASNSTKSLLPNLPVYMGHRTSKSAQPGQIKRIRNNFTEAEDEAMLQYITKAQQQGQQLSSSLLWKGLAAQYPRHTWTSWQARYRTKFYISENPSQADSEDDILPPTTKPSTAQFYLPQHRPLDRPQRQRKPAQKDSHIITWSQAVNTIADVDPDLHAGLQYDANRSNGGGKTWGSFHHVQQTTQRDGRPVSAHEVDELQRDWNRFSEQHPRRNSDGDGRQRPLLEQAKDPHLAHPRVQCPHANCNASTARKYRTIARQHEDDSELFTHLLEAHNITPFPCTQNGCDRNREGGFFSQQDLTSHVRRVHSSLNPAYKSCVQPKEVYIDLTGESPSSKKIKKSTSEAGFLGGNMIYPPRADDASIDTDPTSLSRMIDRTPRVTSSTPPTSFSSVAVQPSLVAQKPREIRDSHEPDAFSSSMVTASQVCFGGRKASPDLGDLPSSAPAFHSLPSQRKAERKHNDLPLQARKDTPDQSHRQGSIELPSMSTQQKPNDNSIMTRKRSKAVAALERSSPQTGRQTHYKETFTRNVVPASHTFSDDDEPQPARPVVTSKPAQQLVEHQVADTPLPTTPSSRKMTSKNPLHRVLSQQEDLDELSLGPADFKIISSHTRSIPQQAFGSVRVKRESSIPANLTSTTTTIATTKKRRFSEILAAEEVDELGADAIFGHSAGPSKRIKRETTVDLNTTPMVYRVKAQRKHTKQAYREEARKSGIDLPVPNRVRSSSVMRAGTPLLDLTPTTSRIVVDPANGSTGKVISGLLTPSRSKVAPAIVVKTPGGTYRKCGEGKFRCGRSFCFRCGSKANASAL